MRRLLDLDQATAEDLFFGQIVIIWARWFVIFAAILMVLWTAAGVAELTGSILPIIGLMASNFLLHGRYLRQQPANRYLLGLVGLLDLALIAALIVLPLGRTAQAWAGPGVLASPFFVLAYPLLLAHAFVFPPRRTLLVTGLVLASYSLACLATDPALLADRELIKVGLARLLTLATMGLLGTLYWRRLRRPSTGAGETPGAARAGLAAWPEQG